MVREGRVNSPLPLASGERAKAGAGQVALARVASHALDLRPALNKINSES